MRYEILGRSFSDQSQEMTMLELAKYKPIPLKLEVLENSKFTSAIEFLKMRPDHVRERRGIKVYYQLEITLNTLEFYAAILTFRPLKDRADFICVDPAYKGRVYDMYHAYFSNKEDYDGIPDGEKEANHFLKSALI